MVSDPISDLLTRLRNATMVSKSNIEIPHSKFKFQLATLLKDEGYVSDVINGNRDTTPRKRTNKTKVRI